LKFFVELKGLMYKGKPLVIWDPTLLTAISDLEVQQVEMKGSLWHVRYPIEATDEFITVATTRPETMLGDTAVAVHPQNQRLKHLIGKTAILPLVGRRIPIVGDDYADPEKGTGAVKITPAHDFNDFEVGRRHRLPMVNVLDVEGKLDLDGNTAFLEDVPASSELDETLTLHGVDRFAARKKIVERLEAAGLLVKVEPHTHMVQRPFRRGDRAVSHRPVVRQRQGARCPGDGGGPGRPHRVRAQELGEDLFRLDGKHPALVHLAATVVGPPDPGLVRTGRKGVRRRDRRRGGVARARLLRRDRGHHAHAGARHGARS
jgi:hypothetical protein